MTEATWVTARTRTGSSNRPCRGTWGVAAGCKSRARVGFLSSRRDGAGALRDQLVMLDPAVLCKIEHRLLVEAADVEIALGDEDLVAIAGRLRDDLTRRRDDAAAGEEFAL